MTEQNIEKRAEALLGFRIHKNYAPSLGEPDTLVEYPDELNGGIVSKYADKFQIQSWQLVLSLLTSLSLCEKTLGEYADEGNWRHKAHTFEETTTNSKYFSQCWNKTQHGYEPAKTTLALLAEKNLPKTTL